MQEFEYKVVPAPRRGEKARGAKTVAERFGVALAHVMNDMARDGWEYLRADTLPCDERVGLTGTATHFQNMLVFRRAIPKASEPEAVTAAPPPPRPAMPDLSDLIPEPEPAPRAPLSPFARPEAGAAPPVGPAAQPPHGAPVVPFPNGGRNS